MVDSSDSSRSDKRMSLYRSKPMIYGSASQRMTFLLLSIGVAVGGTVSITHFRRLEVHVSAVKPSSAWGREGREVVLEENEWGSASSVRISNVNSNNVVGNRVENVQNNYFRFHLRLALDETRRVMSPMNPQEMLNALRVLLEHHASPNSTRHGLHNKHSSSDLHFSTYRVEEEDESAEGAFFRAVFKLLEAQDERRAAEYLAQFEGSADEEEEEEEEEEEDEEESVSEDDESSGSSEVASVADSDNDESTLHTHGSAAPLPLPLPRRRRPPFPMSATDIHRLVKETVAYAMAGTTPQFHPMSIGEPPERFGGRGGGGIGLVDDLPLGRPVESDVVKADCPGQERRGKDSDSCGDQQLGEGEPFKELALQGKTSHASEVQEQDFEAGKRRVQVPPSTGINTSSDTALPKGIVLGGLVLLGCLVLGSKLLPVSAAGSPPQLPDQSEVVQPEKPRVSICAVEEEEGDGEVVEQDSDDDGDGDSKRGKKKKKKLEAKCESAASDSEAPFLFFFALHCLSLLSLLPSPLTIFYTLSSLLHSLLLFAKPLAEFGAALCVFLVTFSRFLVGLVGFVLSFVRFCAVFGGVWWVGVQGVPVVPDGGGDVVLFFCCF